MVLKSIHVKFGVDMKNGVEEIAKPLFLKMATLTNVANFVKSVLSGTLYDEDRPHAKFHSYNHINYLVMLIIP